MTGPVTQLTLDSRMAKQLVRWKVLVTPRVPTVANDPPHGETARMWSSISSTLIYDERDTVLVDAPTTAEQAAALTESVVTSGKNLTAIYVTHGWGLSRCAVIIGHKHAGNDDSPVLFKGPVNTLAISIVSWKRRPPPPNSKIGCWGFTHTT
jgi:hypothetical protein